MPEAATTLLTFEQFEQLPDYQGTQELLDGEVIELPPPENIHNRFAQAVFLLLYDLVARLHAEGALGRVAEVFHEVGYRLGPNTWLIPDVSITWTGQREGKYFERAPALAIEVISPSNSAREMDAKVAAYLAAGGEEVWVIYPETGRIWVHRAGSNHAELKPPRFTSEILEGAEIDLEPLLKR